MKVTLSVSVDLGLNSQSDSRSSRHFLGEVEFDNVGPEGESTIGGGYSTDKGLEQERPGQCGLCFQILGE